MMIFSFLPMLSMFNSQISKVAQFTYLEQIYRLLKQPGNLQVDSRQIYIIGCNILFVIVLFEIAYKRCGLAAE